MFKVRIIPCLDVKDGRVVKGVNFVDLRDAGDPVEAAIAYDAAGADELTFLDITASHENRGTMLDVVRRTAEACFMPVTVGGGVRTVEDIRVLLQSGADPKLGSLFYRNNTNCLHQVFYFHSDPEVLQKLFDQLVTHSPSLFDTDFFFDLRILTSWPDQSSWVSQGSCDHLFGWSFNSSAFSARVFSLF